MKAPSWMQFARRRRLVYTGLWLIIVEIVVTLVISELAPTVPRICIWALILGPALAYLLALWRWCRCPACGALLLLDSGPYQRLVFNLNAKTCPHCGAPLA
jgi:hypothetical protein